MPLEREIRAIELQKETALDDGLVFDLDGDSDGSEICLFTVVIFVFHCGGNDPGRRRCHERLDEAAWLRFEGSAKIGNLGIQFCVVDVTHFADRLGWLVIAHSLARGEHLRHLLLEKRITFDIAARPALPAVAETAHPMPDVEKKRLALLLAVVADIDTGFDLLVDDPAQCRLANPVELSRIDRLATGAAHIEPGEFGWPRQATRMGCQNPLVAPPHRGLRSDPYLPDPRFTSPTVSALGYRGNKFKRKMITTTW